MMTRAYGYIWQGQRMPHALDVLAPAVRVPGTPTLLIGWELGGGRGHVERLVPVVTAYLEQGWRVIAVLRDRALGENRLTHLSRQFGIEKLLVIAAPAFADRFSPDEPLVSLAQIFCYMGFDDPKMLRPLVRQWEDLLRHYRPDRVLSDYAPALNLAARGRVPLTVIGNGWTLPPACAPLPPVRPLPADAMLADHETPLTRCAAQVVGEARAPERFCDLLCGDVNVLCVIPELDPYRAERTDTYYWSPEMPAPAPVPKAQRQGGLVYLPADHPDREAVTKACAMSDIPFKAYFDGAFAGKVGNLTVSAEPLDFIREVPRSKVVIHHGGLGTTMWAMVNGVAQWGCAKDLEKAAIANLEGHRN